MQPPRRYDLLIRAFELTKDKDKKLAHATALAKITDDGWRLVQVACPFPGVLQYYFERPRVEKRDEWDFG